MCKGHDQKCTWGAGDLAAKAQVHAVLLPQPKNGAHLGDEVLSPLLSRTRCASRDLLLMRLDRTAYMHTSMCAKPACLAAQALCCWLSGLVRQHA